MSERRNLPSASGLQRYALCPGSFLMEQGIPEAPQSPDAEMGNRIHAWLAGETVTPPLNDEEERIAEACKRQADKLREELIGEYYSANFEHRIWAKGSDREPAWSGKPDAVFYQRGLDYALVIDFKTGRGDVEDAASNLQLRALAVLVYWGFGVQTITVAIVQPLAGLPSLCTYTQEDLERAGFEVTEIMARVRKPGQPRIPSTEACKYCRAKAICPEAREAALIPPVVNAPVGITPEAMAATLTNDTLAGFLERAQFATRVIEACKDEAKARLERGEKIPGWTLKPGAVRESITQPETVFARFANAGGTTEQFMGAVSIAKGKLKDAVKAATGDKGKTLDARMDAILEGCTEAKPTAPSLVRVKEEV